MKVVGFTKLILELQEEDPSLILCYGKYGEPNMVHLVSRGNHICGGTDQDFYKSSVCGEAVHREVVYFNGGQPLERFCPHCFKQYRTLLEILADA